MDSEWTVDQVEFSVDEGDYFPAELMESGSYDIALRDLDIGASDLTVRVTTSNAGHVQETYFHDRITGVVPVFDCGSPSSMVPSNDLIRQNGSEVRTMLGYFGDPDGGHTVTFVIAFTNDNGDPFENAAEVVTYGRKTIDAAFNVNRFSCGDNCSDDYDLSLYVDGDLFCSENSFGLIFDY